MELLNSVFIHNWIMGSSKYDNMFLAEYYTKNISPNYLTLGRRLGCTYFS
jgi:hypothetical protein